MSQRSVFYQTCPVCGRSLRMPVDAFGRQVTCVHCGGQFRSTGSETAAPMLADQPTEGPLALRRAMPLAFVVDCFPPAGATRYPTAGPS